MSVASFDFAAPSSAKIEFHVDRLRAAGVASAALLAGGLIGYPAAVRWLWLDQPAELLAAVVALAGASMLIAAGLFVAIKLLLRRDALVVIDADGIHDRRTTDAPLPWSRIHDIRVLDRYGHHIGIETREDSAEAGDAALRSPHSGLPRPITVIDTFFLRSGSGNRFLDFILPITAVAPIEMSETPVSADTLSADARISRNRKAAVSLFILAAAILPSAAAILLTAR
jgi:hypothetical protein